MFRFRASYEYDARNQLRTVKDGGNQTIASYDYDFERQRLSKTIGLNSIRYVYAGSQVVNEYSDTNTLLSRYDVGAGEVVRAEFSVEGERFFFSDALGSTTSLVQAANNQITARYEYDAFGSFFNTQGSSVNSINFTGQRLDYETGLMPLGNGERYYSSGLGRFIQQDSWTGMAQMAQSLNRYAYSFNNPLSYTDPTGNEPDAVQQWFRETIDVIERYPSGNWTSDFITNYGLHMHLAMYSAGKGFVKGIFNTVAEPFRMTADKINYEIYKTMGIELKDMQFSSSYYQGWKQRRLAGESNFMATLKSEGEFIFNLVTLGQVELVTQVVDNAIAYNNGEISRVEYNERQGEALGNELAVYAAVKGGQAALNRGNAKPTVTSESLV